MQISVDNEKKVVGLWYLKNEDMNIPAEISPMIEEYRKNKYIVCKYQSGDGNIIKLTSDLLISNLKKMCE